jgi:hypothetical protein
LFTEEEYKLAKYKDLLKVSCDYCSQEYSKSKHAIYRARAKNTKKYYCSKPCGSLARYNKVTFNCANCNTVSTKPKAQVKAGSNNFCSSSCSVTYNNKGLIRRRIVNDCSICSAPLRNKKLKKCTSCFKASLNIDHSLDSIKSAHCLVRQRARIIAKQLGWTSCFACGYNKHIEVAHIKAVSTFPKSTRVSEVNTVDNLVPLCPNCHWEFDNNLLSLPSTNSI